MASVSLTMNVYYIVFLVAAECVADVAMVIDSSGSIRDANKPGRKDNYDLIKEVCKLGEFSAVYNTFLYRF